MSKYTKLFIVLLLIQSAILFTEIAIWIIAPPYSPIYLFLSSTAWGFTYWAYCHSLKHDQDHYR